MQTSASRSGRGLQQRAEIGATMVRTRERGRASFHRLGPRNPPRAISAARTPDWAAQPACIRFVQVPSARYSIIPEAMLPAIPSAETSASGGSRRAAPAAAAAAIAPNTAVGWNPARCVAMGATRLSLHKSSAPVTMPRSRRSPPSPSLSHTASTAGTTTAPEWTGPPSNVSSKSSPCAPVPLTSAALKASNPPSWPSAVRLPDRPPQDRSDVGSRRGNTTRNVRNSFRAISTTAEAGRRGHPRRDDFGWRVGARQRALRQNGVI